MSKSFASSVKVSIERVPISALARCNASISAPRGLGKRACSRSILSRVACDNMIRLPVAFTADHVDHVEGWNDIGQPPPDNHSRQGLHVGKAGRTTPAFVRLARAVADQVEANLTVGAFDGEVALGRRHQTAIFNHQFELIDQFLRTVKHTALAGPSETGILCIDWSTRYLLKTLQYHSTALANLLHPHEVAI